MKSIIYLPGLGYDYFDISGYNYAERYMSSLDKMNPDKSKKYYLEKKEFRYGFDNIFNAPVTSIYEYQSTKEEKKEVCRIYECFYADNLTEKFKKKNILAKLVLILFTLLGKAWILIKTVIKSQFLSARKRFESFYFFSIFCLIAIFAILLFPAILTSFTGALNQLFTEDSLQLNLILNNMGSWVTFSYWVTTITALLTTILPDFRGFISNTATEFLCLDYYLTIGDNKMEIVGKLESLVEKVAEADDYSAIEIHGYSFGSIILIDTMFPFGNKPTLRLSNEIKNIVTIGCPHDFISTYYPNYFEKRNSSDASMLENWHNIYSEVDILSSNFRLDKKKEQGNFKLTKNSISVNNIFFDIINADTLTFWNHVGVIGIRAHRMFWGKGADASNCLNLLLEKK